MSKIIRPEVYIDLEDTLITNWNDQHLLMNHCHSIRQFLKHKDCSRFHIFSFAIYDAADKETFERSLLRLLETTLEARCASWPSVDEIMKRDYNLTRTRFDQHERSQWMSVRGKQDAFRNYILDLDHGRAIDAVLIDDVVPDVRLSYRRTHINIDFVNVDSVLSLLPE